MLAASSRREPDQIGDETIDGIDYEVTLPVTPEVLAAVRPEWRSYFAVKAR